MKKLILILGVMVISISASYLFAGTSLNAPVTITTNGATTTISGALYATRHTADTIAYLFCQSNTLGTEGSCGAIDSSGNPAVGYTSDPNVIAQIHSISTTSYIHCVIDNATAQIITLVITQGSHVLP